jgi:hypothetical protein
MPKFLWKHKRFELAKAILRKKSNVSGITILDLKIMQQNHSDKCGMVLAHNRHVDHWTRTDDTEINPTRYYNLIIDKVA